MKRSILMAMSTSILLTGCLVKKSTYEAELSAHEETKAELQKVSDELATTTSDLESKTSALSTANKDLDAMRAALSKSKAGLVQAQKDVEALQAKADSYDELNADLAAAQKKLEEAKAIFTKRFKELKDELAEQTAGLKTENEELRKFMVTYYSDVSFAAKDAEAKAQAEAEAAEMEKAATVVVTKAPEAVVEAEAPAEVAAEESAEMVEAEAAPAKKSWWKFWGKKTVEAPEYTFDLAAYKAALGQMDEQGAAQEALALVSEQTDGSAIAALGTQLMNEAVATEDLGMVKWVTAGIVKGAGKQQDVAKDAVVASLEGTPYKDAVVELLNN